MNLFDEESSGGRDELLDVLTEAVTLGPRENRLVRDAVKAEYRYKFLVLGESAVTLSCDFAIQKQSEHPVYGAECQSG